MVVTLNGGSVKVSMRQHLNRHLNDKEPVLQRPTEEQPGLREQQMEKTYGGHEPGEEKGLRD